ncbi:MAG: hypothetical protein LUC45_08380 [Paraprevotella sp.]|nr:hypothetical protein [Paraprevotella sp.]
MRDMQIKDFLGAMLFLWGCIDAPPLSAQLFRRVTDTEIWESGTRCLVAGYCRDTPDSVWVMSAQTQTGIGVKRRAARKLKPDADGRIRIDDDGTAVFECVTLQSSYAFRDLGLNAWLAYSTEKSSSTSPLYTLTDEELSGNPSKPKVKYYHTFDCTFPSPSGFRKTPLRTKEEIPISTVSGKYFGLLFDFYTGTFKLSVSESSLDDSLFLYKEVQPPVMEASLGGDWTFKGDWLADSLFRIDYSQAGRVDFTEMSLPSEGKVSGNVRLPGPYVWTYVRKGEASRLPADWPYVIEIDRKEAEVPGMAVTPIVGNDSAVLGPKYAFAVPAGTGISWYRDVSDDGGWFSVGLPFSVQRLTWEDVGGEPLASDRLAFEKVSTEGVVSRRMESGEAWEAGVPYLWRPKDFRASSVCFHADEATVQVHPQGDESADGFHATFVRREITDEGCGLFLLDDSGIAFVPLAAGSWMAPCRGYLNLSESAGRLIRVVESSGLSDVNSVSSSCPDMRFPVYSSDGRRQGRLKAGEGVPAGWPKGIYLTPGGKIRHP